MIDTVIKSKLEKGEVIDFTLNFNPEKSIPKELKPYLLIKRVGECSYTVSSIYTVPSHKIYQMEKKLNYVYEVVYNVAGFCAILVGIGAIATLFWLFSFLMSFTY